MSTSVMGYSTTSTGHISPGMTSPYPDRPIRPLPKRRLRERLSPDVADAIKYPPAPKVSAPLFYHPYNLREDVRAFSLQESQHATGYERADEIEQRNYISRRNNGEELDSDEDESGYRSRSFARQTGDISSRSYRYVLKPDSKHPKSHPPGSNASSVDGYDSFENTNNKKKRKIPTPGDSALNSVHLSNEMANMGISGPEDLIEELGNSSAVYHGSGSIVHGISGPGRGRYGRIRNGRSPLRTLSDASSNWSNGRTSKQRQPQWPSQKETSGIISSAIASANAEKVPIAPAPGQENVSLLQQQASKKQSPTPTQFTFTCDSQVPGTLPWPGPTTSSTMNQSIAAKSLVTEVPHTSPGILAGHNVNSGAIQSKQGVAASQYAPSQAKQGSAPTAAPQKHRRRTGKEYLIAARERRQQQEYRNFHHPPAPEDIWICEFCEYERIFGTPPEALIKQYEIKDRRQRKQEAERRRLLEKAKMKGRKGKKGGKVAAKPSTAAQDRQTHPQPAQTPAVMHHSQNQSLGTQSEDYFEDEYDKDSAHDISLSLSSAAPPAGFGPPVPFSSAEQEEAHKRAILAYRDSLRT